MCQVEKDVSATGHARLTCYECQETLVSQPWMTTADWERLKAEFLEKHTTKPEIKTAAQ